MNDRILKIFSSLIFILLFNLLFFVLGGTDQPASSWWSYAFIHLAYFILLAVPRLGKYVKGLTVLTATLYIPAILYFGAELVLGTLWIVLALDSVTWPLLTQCILLGFFLFITMSMMRANQATEASIQKQRTESFHIQTLVQQVRSRLRDIENEELRKPVERCYDALSNCSLESFPQAQDAEMALRTAVSNLCDAIDDGKEEDIARLAKKTFNAIQDRNAAIRLCRMH